MYVNNLSVLLLHTRKQTYIVTITIIIYILFQDLILLSNQIILMFQVSFIISICIRLLDMQLFIHAMLWDAYATGAYTFNALN